MWSKILGALGGGVKAIAEPIVGYLTKRSEYRHLERVRKMEFEDAVHRRRIELISQGLAADATWEIESIRAHTSGWKDEAVLVMFMLPFVLCFFPQTAPYVAAGFVAISGTPVWYQIGAMSVFLATYGIRWWRRTQSDT